MAILLENYTTGNDDFTSVYSAQWGGQTFTATSNHTITSVKILAYRLGNAGTLTLSIRDTSAGKPTGSDLVSGTLDVSGITTSTSGELIEVTFATPLTVTSGTVYAIVCSATGADTSNRLKWNTQTTGAYAGGQFSSSSDGSSWTGQTFDNMFQIYGEPSLTTNLVSYYKLDESSGNASDSVGSNTLTNTNTVGYAAALINNGADFGATNSDKSFTSSGRINLTGNFTLSVWVKLRANPANGVAYQFIDIADNTGNVRAMIQLYNNGGQNQLYFGRVGTASTYVSGGINVSALGTTVWHRLTLTYNGTNIQAYMDGSEIGTATDASGTTATLSANLIRLGRDIGTAFYASTYMDEVGVWTRALSSTEETTLYNSGNGLQYPFIGSGPSNMKTWNGVPIEQIKTINGVPIASVKSFNSIT